jgi:hypothetical protein
MLTDNKIIIPSLFTEFSFLPLLAYRIYGSMVVVVWYGTIPTSRGIYGMQYGCQKIKWWCYHGRVTKQHFLLTLVARLCLYRHFTTAVCVCTCVFACVLAVATTSISV